MDLQQEVEGYTCEEVETSFVLLGTNIMFVTFHVFIRPGFAKNIFSGFSGVWFLALCLDL
jgi:hypothetical protein